MSDYWYDLEWFDIPGFCTAEDKASGVVRAYKTAGASEYDGGATIIKREGGLHEPLLWWVHRGSPADLSVQGAKFLIQKGLRLAWTFEVKKFKYYKRLLRQIGKLKIIETFEKQYNGVFIEFHYGELVPHKSIKYALQIPPVYKPGDYKVTVEGS